MTEKHPETIATMESISRLSRDLKVAAKTLTDKEARFLVDTYYQMQDNRIRAENQIRSMADEPHGTLNFFMKQGATLELQIKSALDVYSMGSRLGEWARGHTGIGPVLAAGLMAHIDLTKAPTAGHIWNYAGLNPLQRWEKGQKRPWNAQLKVICWKIGESFTKVSGKDKAFYGKIYAERKAWEVEQNELGAFSKQAAKALEDRNYRKETEAYKAYIKGKLPPAHVHARAKRFAVKLFLSHYHEVGRKVLGLEVPEPYVIAHLGHAHKIPVPDPVR